MNFIDKNAIKLFLGLLFLIVLFHFCIIFKIIPYNIAWGGRLQNDSEMYFFETISILINAFLSWVLLMKGNFVKYKFPQRTILVENNEGKKNNEPLTAFAKKGHKCQIEDLYF